MRFLRIIGGLGIVAVAVLASDRLAYEPWKCDVMRRVLEPATLRQWERHGFFVASTARENAVRARSCIRMTPCNAAPYMLAAANDRLAGDYSRAAAMYEEALRYERRPELYFNLGLVQLDLARIPEAEENFVKAGSFDPYTILEIPPEDIRNRVMVRVGNNHYLPWWGPEQPALKALRR